MSKRTLQEIARQQHGYFTAQQAIASGYAHRHHTYHTGRGNWLCVERGLFRLPGYPDTVQSQWVRWSFWAIGRSPARRIVVSHDSALHFYGLAPVAPDAVHLSVPTRLFRKEEREGCIFHRQDLEEGDFHRHPGFCITTPLRTLLDLKPDLMLQGSWMKTVRAAIACGQIAAEEGRLLLGEKLFQQLEQAPVFSATTAGPLAMARQKGATMRTTVSNRSFTLVEMLVVIAIISILAALLLPSLQKSLEMTRSVSCQSNLRQIGMALSQYSDRYNGWTLSAGAWNDAPQRAWYKLLTDDKSLPYTLFACPEDPSFAFNWFSLSYGINYHTVGEYPGSVSPPQKLAQITSFGRSSGLIWVTDSTNSKYQTSGAGAAMVQGCVYPVQGTGQWYPVHIRHLEKANTVFFDGHAAPLSVDALLTPAPYWRPRITGGVLGMN